MNTEQQKSLRIVMLGHKRIPSREGGIEVAVGELAVRMAAQGHRVTCYNRSGHHAAGREFDTGPRKTYRGVRLKKVPTIDAKGLAAVSASVFASLAAALGPYDVVHCHGEGSAAMLWLPRLFGKRCVVTIHGLDWQREKWRGGFGARYIRFGEKIAVKYAHEIIVLSPAAQDYFCYTYGRRTRYIPNGVSCPESRPPRMITARYGLRGEDYILYLGRLVPEKGLRHLIRAYRELDTDKRLVIAGGADSGRFLQELRALAEGDGRILFCGFVQGELLEELYSNAYVYVLPSELEGMPLGLLEAMGSGNCCLTSDIPECTQVTGINGLTFRKGDAEDLRRKLDRLCHEEGLVRAYREQAADRVREKFNWDQVTAQTLAVYGGKA